MAGIDNIRSGQTLTTTSRAPARSDASKENASNQVGQSSSRQDAVTLSQGGKAIGQMHQQMANQPSFDSAKVEAIKDAIANGSYKVDAEKLADNMVKFEDELGGLR
jgi:negative regulator of flagellin synthesis FlgM